MEKKIKRRQIEKTKLKTREEIKNMKDEMKKEILKELMSTLMKESKKEGFFQAKKEIQRREKALKILLK